MWRRFRHGTAVSAYPLSLPPDIREGQYVLMVCSWQEHLQTLRKEKAHQFKVRSLREQLGLFNQVASVRMDKLYLRLTAPRTGISVDGVEFPDLPSFRQRIIRDSKRTDVTPYLETLVAAHETPYVVSGARKLAIRVDKRADQ